MLIYFTYCLIINFPLSFFIRFRHSILNMTFEPFQYTYCKRQPPWLPFDQGPTVSYWERLAFFDGYLRPETHRNGLDQAAKVGIKTFVCSLMRADDVIIPASGVWVQWIAKPIKEMGLHLCSSMLYDILFLEIARNNPSKLYI